MFEQVRTIVAEVFGYEPEDIHEDSSIEGEDSLDTLDLAFRIEREFDIDIPNEDLEGLQTMKELVRYIEEKTKNQPSK